MGTPVSLCFIVGNRKSQKLDRPCRIAKTYYVLSSIPSPAPPPKSAKRFKEVAKETSSFEGPGRRGALIF